MNVVSIIIARGGSKGIPNKNIIDFCGKPLISWTIKQSQISKKVSDVWVSSDSNAILDIAKKNGAKTIDRPIEISNDKSTSESAWLHAIKYIENKEGYPKIDYVLAPQVTSPLRDPSDFSKAIGLIISEQADSLLSVAEVEDFFIWKKNKNKDPESVNYDYKNRQLRQNIGKKYLENGSFYIFKPNLLINNNRLGGKKLLFEMERYKMFQIDNIEDVQLCSVIMSGYNLDKI
jgi:CMP-N,N'-diacetyllegionaminic acid synthase